MTLRLKKAGRRHSHGVALWRHDVDVVKKHIAVHNVRFEETATFQLSTATLRKKM